METLVLDSQAFISVKKIRIKSNKAKVSAVKASDKEVHVKLSSDVDENLANYLEWHGLTNQDQMLVLPSTQFYYYDCEELKGVKTLINARKLNLTRHLDDFLKTLCQGLSADANFIGCFYDSKTEKIGFPLKFYRKFIDFIDFRFNVEMNGREFTRRLESCGLRVIDMTEINGITYFRTKKHMESSIR